MKKKACTRVLSLLLAVLLLFSLPMFAGAAATGGTTGQAHWSYDKSTRTLTFSGTGSTGDYNYFTGWGDTYYPYADYLYTWRQGYAKKAVVEAGITRIGDCFLADSGVTEVVLPSTLTTIGPRAFIFCGKLNTINIPVGVKKVGMSAFAQCGYASGDKKIAGKGLTVYYEGTRAQWAQIHFEAGNLHPDDDALANAKIVFLGDTPYPGTPFVDIKDHWGREPIKWAYEQGLFSGLSETEFGPGGTMSRGMLVTVLHRLAGEPAPEMGNPFQDIGTTWYTNAVRWAAENGIVNGVNSSYFDPDGLITREQAAKILYGYAQKYGKDVSIDPGALSGFPDQGNVSSWAQDAMAWAVSHNVLKGSGGSLNPGGTATRAEVAQIFYNCKDLLA